MGAVTWVKACGDLADGTIGAVHELECLPPSLLLRAVGVQRALPEDQLPPLAPGTDRKGLFILRRDTCKFQRPVTGDTKITVRRDGFHIVPADTRTAHAAQGETWDAVIGIAGPLSQFTKLDRTTEV